MSVLFPNDFGFQDAEERKKGKGKERGDGDGHGLEDPPKGRPQSDSEGDGSGVLQPSEFPSRPANQDGKQGSRPKHKGLGATGRIICILVFLSWHA